MSAPYELGRNMLGCVEIIWGVGFYNRLVVCMAAKKAAELKC
jgi:hypothetical protein